MLIKVRKFFKKEEGGVIGKGPVQPTSGQPPEKGTFWTKDPDPEGVTLERIGGYRKKTENELKEKKPIPGQSSSIGRRHSTGNMTSTKKTVLEEHKIPTQEEVPEKYKTPTQKAVIEEDKLKLRRTQSTSDLPQSDSSLPKTKKSQSTGAHLTDRLKERQSSPEPNKPVVRPGPPLFKKEQSFKTVSAPVRPVSNISPTPPLQTQIPSPARDPNTIKIVEKPQQEIDPIDIPLNYDQKNTKALLTDLLQKNQNLQEILVNYVDTNGNSLGSEVIPTYRYGDGNNFTIGERVTKMLMNIEENIQTTPQQQVAPKKPSRSYVSINSSDNRSVSESGSQLSSSSTKSSVLRFSQSDEKTVSLTKTNPDQILLTSQNSELYKTTRNILNILRTNQKVNKLTISVLDRNGQMQHSRTFDISNYAKKSDSENSSVIKGLANQIAISISEIEEEIGINPGPKLDAKQLQRLGIKKLELSKKEGKKTGSVDKEIKKVSESLESRKGIQVTLSQIEESNLKLLSAKERRSIKDKMTRKSFDRGIKSELSRQIRTSGSLGSLHDTSDLNRLIADILPIDDARNKPDVKDMLQARFIQQTQERFQGTFDSLEKHYETKINAIDRRIAELKKQTSSNRKQEQDIKNEIQSLKLEKLNFLKTQDLKTKLLTKEYKEYVAEPRLSLKESQAMRDFRMQKPLLQADLLVENPNLSNSVEKIKDLKRDLLSSQEQLQKAEGYAGKKFDDIKNQMRDLEKQIAKKTKEKEGKRMIDRISPNRRSALERNAVRKSSSAHIKQLESELESTKAQLDGKNKENFIKSAKKNAQKHCDLSEELLKTTCKKAVLEQKEKWKDVEKLTTKIGTLQRKLTDLERKMNSQNQQQNPQVRNGNSYTTSQESQEELNSTMQASQRRRNSQESVSSESGYSSSEGSQEELETEIANSQRRRNNNVPNDNLPLGADASTINASQRAEFSTPINSSEVFSDLGIEDQSISSSESSGNEADIESLASVSSTGTNVGNPKNPIKRGSSKDSGVGSGMK